MDTSDLIKKCAFYFISFLLVIYKIMTDIDYKERLLEYNTKFSQD